MIDDRGAWMKDIELRLISELMKNSRRSDRELAKAIGISQPTIGNSSRRATSRNIRLFPILRSSGLKCSLLHLQS
jgi:DNA-binding Lrp family transcriptional regulator